MRVLFLAGRELTYMRNNVLLRAFKRFGTVDVIGENKIAPITSTTLRVTLRVLPYLLNFRYDLIFVGFYGQLLMLSVPHFVKGPVLFDAFISTFDTVCFDRKLYHEHSLMGRLAFWLDQTSCLGANHVLLDTQLHIEYFVKTFGLPLNKFDALPVGSNEDIFYPRPKLPTKNTQILFYCSYQPLHGIETVIRSAKLLDSETPVIFRLIGKGPELQKARQLAEEWGLKNIVFVPPLPLEMLAEEIADADICLGGHFGSGAKAARVVPGKIYQILSMRRPLIAANTSANKQILDDNENACLCSPSNAEELAKAIVKLHQDPILRDYIAQNGYLLYKERFSEQEITKQLQKIVQRLVR